MSLQVTIPIGYELIEQKDAHRSVYTFKYLEKLHEIWYSWTLGAVDAMWRDVRDRATKEADPRTVPNRAERNNLIYATGYADGKFHTTEEIRKVLNKNGYVMDVQEPVEVVKILLQLLNGR